MLVLWMVTAPRPGGAEPGQPDAKLPEPRAVVFASVPRVPEARNPTPFSQNPWGLRCGGGAAKVRRGCVASVSLVLWLVVSLAGWSRADQGSFGGTKGGNQSAAWST